MFAVLIWPPNTWLASKGWLLPRSGSKVLTQHCSWLSAHCLPPLASRQAALSDGVLPRPSSPATPQGSQWSTGNPAHLCSRNGWLLPRTASCLFPCPNSRGSSSSPPHHHPVWSNFLETLSPPKLCSIVVAKPPAGVWEAKHPLADSSNVYKRVCWDPFFGGRGSNMTGLSTHVSSLTTRNLTDEPPIKVGHRGWYWLLMDPFVHLLVSPKMMYLVSFLNMGAFIIRCPCLEALAENSPSTSCDTGIGSLRKRKTQGMENRQMFCTLPGSLVVCLWASAHCPKWRLWLAGLLGCSCLNWTQAITHRPQGLRFCLLASSVSHFWASGTPSTSFRLCLGIVLMFYLLAVAN